MKTEEDKFWGGECGNEYITRSLGANLEARLALFRQALESAPITSIYEPGAGHGPNMGPLRSLYPDAKLYGSDINELALEKLKDVCNCTKASILDKSPYQADLVVTFGTLVTIAPENIDKAYKHIYEASNDLILICEYHNPTVLEVEYRGHKIWKRDFAGDMMDKYSMSLVRYGFVSRRDPLPLFDVTWFLLRK